MCIYIDEHIYEPDHDVNRIFTYIQRLFYILSMKKHFFNNMKYYDEYSLYAATQLYLRYVNKNQFLPENDPKHIPKIKSVLNYIKKTLYATKVSYQQQFFNQEFADNGCNESIQADMVANIREPSQEYLKIDIIEYLERLPKLIKTFLKELPYSNDEVLSYNIYISCLITLLRSITLSNYNSNKILNKKTNNLKSNIDDIIDKIYMEENLNAPVTYHLNKELSTFIAVICNRLKKLISKDIQELISYYDLSDEILKNILVEPLSTLTGDNNE